MLTTLAFLLLSAPSWERILLPVVTRGPLPGANGSSWETVVTIRNASDQPVVYFPTDCPLVPPVPERFCLQNPRPELPPGVTKRVELVQSGPVFLNVTPELAGQVFVQLRVHDLSRQAESFGTELPVIRASEMKTGAGQILDIPADPRFRLTFRLYADHPGRESAIVVRFINEAAGQQRELPFTVPPVPAEVPADEALTFPALYQQLSDFDASRIEIEAGEGLRWWAFVSVTNNETQQITTLTAN